MKTNNRYLEPILLFGSIACITAFHYAMPMHREPIHEMLRRLYYLPIVYAAVRMGWRGGLWAGGAIFVLYLPHMVYYIKAHTCQSINNYADMLLFLALGGGIGCLVDRYRHADRLAVVGATTARLVHDMKNPIASIDMAAQLLKEELPCEKRAKFVEIISASVQRFVNLTTELLEFSRGGASSLNFSLFSVKSFVEGMANSLRPEFERRGILFVMEVEESGQARWDWDRMRRVVGNIGRNALEVLPAGGTFKITSAAEKDKVRLRFIDDGPGVPARIRSRIFDAFFSYGKAGGTGLGLAIARDIVAQHGGWIEVESSVGKGTTFVVTLPRTPPLPGGHPQGEKRKADD